MLPRVRPIPSAAPLIRRRVASTLALLCFLGACTSGYGPTVQWHGRAYAGPTRYYPPPGTPEDPWGPYIREASERYGVPEQWIREVMRQESDGQEQAVSSAGAMGLMQIMPDTFDELRQRYALGGDPFEPHDNIMAGAAYILEMYNHYGAPGFLAAYNAGPHRLEGYLSGGDSLPNETVNYVASIAPRLGSSVHMTGPLAVYAQGGNVARDPAVPVGQVTAPVAVASRGVEACDQDAAYDPDRPCEPAPTLTATAPVAVRTASGCDFDAAYDPSGACPHTTTTASPDVPAAVTSRSSLYQHTAPVASTSAPAETAPAALISATASSGAWAIQVGAFSSQVQAREIANGVHDALADLLTVAQIELPPTSPFGGRVVYRARLSNLSANAANAACARLAASQQPCMVIAPGQEL
jgi:D-alanyl-D-alanine carboxypeptidase